MIDPLSPNPYESSNVHIFGARGHRWKRIRTITSSTLNTTKLRQMLPLILEEMDDFIVYLLKQNVYYSDSEIDVHSLFQQLTASVIGRCALGLEKNAFENPPKHFKYFKQVFGPEPTISMDFQTFQWIIPMTTKFLSLITDIIWKSSKNPIDKLNDFITKLLSKKIKRKNAADILQNLKEFETFDNCYLQTAKMDYNNILNLDNSKKAEKLHTNEIISTIRFLSIAGFDTTANTLSFACFLLAENPEKLEKVFEEIDSLSKSDDKLDYDILSEAIYINAVLLETLRLFPHASMYIFII
uniref:Cytochrome P450 n=1 Tax=Panagrolaimus superbus TaxID=310955 RepID=A0A914YRS7_9BILA